MATIAVIASRDYPDQDEICDHLSRMHAKGHRIIIRARDHVLKSKLVAMGIPFEEIAPESPGKARKEHPLWPDVKNMWTHATRVLRDGWMQSTADFVVVFHEVNSATTAEWCKENPKYRIYTKGTKKKLEPPSRKTAGTYDRD